MESFYQGIKRRNFHEFDLSKLVSDRRRRRQGGTGTDEHQQFTYLTVVTTDHHRAQPPHWDQPKPAHRHHVNIRNHHGQHPIQHA